MIFKICSCANEFKGISHFLFYHVLCEVFDPLGVEYYEGDIYVSIAILLSVPVMFE